MNLNKILNLRQVVGKKVKLLANFYDIPANTRGIVEGLCGDEVDGIIVVFPGGRREGFIRSSESGDDTAFLALIGGIDKTTSAR